MKSYNLCEGGRALGIAFGTLLIAGLLLVNGASAATWTVDDSGGANYTRIQDAIDNASAGDTILVYSGTYYENVNVNKQLTLRSIGMPFVDARGSGSAITLSAGLSTLEGFTAKGAGSNPEAGIKVTSSSNMLSGNNASSNNGFGIYLYSSSGNTLSGNNVSNNSEGIYLYSSRNNMLNGNNVNSNNYEYAIGIELVLSSDNTLSGNNANSNENAGISLSSSSDNTLSGNNANSNKNDGILLSSSSGNTLSGNNANSNNGVGISLYSSSGNTLDSSSDNTLSGNNASNNYYGIYVSSSSNNTVYNNYFSNNYFSNGYDNGINIWNITKTAGINIIGGHYLGGNYWSDYAGNDTNGDGLGDTLLPFNAGGNIGDYLPLVLASAVNISPVADFIYSPLNPLVNQTITFDASPSYVPDGNITSYWWNISGNKFTTKIVSISFPFAETVYAELEVTDNNGATNSTAKWINVTVPTQNRGSISGFKINDTNGNGKWNAGEKGISNWTIKLIGIIGKGKDSKVIRKETLTDATGFYKFDNLPAGRYFLIEKLKKGFVPTSSPFKGIKLAQGKNSMNNNFTNRPVQSRDKKDDIRNIDDYEAINRDIDKYKEDTNGD